MDYSLSKLIGVEYDNIDTIKNFHLIYWNKFFEENKDIYDYNLRERLLLKSMDYEIDSMIAFNNLKVEAKNWIVSKRKSIDKSQIINHIKTEINYDHYNSDYVVFFLCENINRELKTGDYYFVILDINKMDILCLKKYIAKSRTPWLKNYGIVPIVYLFDQLESDVKEWIKNN